MRLAVASYILSCCWLGLCLMAVCGPVQSVLAVDIYVNNVAGDDRRDGSSPESGGGTSGPCRTIGRALQLADGSDRIVLAKTDEPYRESITLQAGPHSGTASSPFTLVGNGATLDGRQPVPIAAWEHFRGDVYRFTPNRKAYQLLFLGEKPAVRQPVERGASSFPELAPLQWCLFRGQIYFRTEPGQVPQSYELSHTVLQVGLGLYEVRNVVIEDLVIQGFQLDGVNAHDSVFGARLTALTCRGNGRSGIAVGGASRVQVESCLSGANGAAQLLVEGFCHVRLEHCELLPGPSAPEILRRGGEVVVVEEPMDETAADSRVLRR